MKIRTENLVLMNGRELIAAADQLGVRVACNKERTALKEKKSVVVERIAAQLAKIEAEKAEQKAKAQKAEKQPRVKKERTPEEIAERKATRKAAKLAKRAENMEKTSELLESGLYPYNGRTQSLTEWSKELGISRKNLYRRIHYFGWSIERAFEA